ncbi:MAG: subclass B1 metallo-beta-lactamase [Calditrichaceae bacterium]|jgi:metallo-beta-lactamase class B
MNRLWYYFILMYIGLCGTILAETINKISNDLEIKRISDHCYLHISYFDLENAPHFPANGLIYINGDEGYIIDTPWTNELTKQLLDYLQDSMQVSIAGVIVTHWHEDCMGGLEAVHKAGIKSYAFQMTAELCKQKNLPVPQNKFSDSMIIGINNDLVLKYPGPGHTEDNIIVYIPEEKVLFAGCMTKALGWNSLGFTGDANIPKWPETLKKVLKVFPKAEIVIPGHGEPGGLDIIEHTLSLF